MAGKEIRAGRAYLELVLRDQVAGALKRTAARLRAFATLTSTIGAGLAGASAAILTPLTATVKQFAATGEQLQNMAFRTGLSTAALSELAHAAALSDTSLEAMEAGLRKLHDTVLDAARGSTQARAALWRLGLSARTLATMSPDQRLAAIADRLVSITSPALRTAVALEVFGKAGVQILPMLAGGAAGLAEMRKEARALGLTMSADTVKSAAELDDALNVVWSAVRGLSLQIASALGPVVTDLAERITSVIAVVTQFVRQNQQLVVQIATVAAVAGAAGMAFFGLSSIAALTSVAFSGLAAAVGAAGTVLGAITATIASVFTPVGLITTAFVGAAGAWLYFSGAGSRAIDMVMSRLGQLAGFVRQVIGGIGDALLAGDLQLASRILWSGVQVVWYRAAAGLASVWTTVLQAARVALSQIKVATQTAAAWISQQWSRIAESATSLWRLVPEAVSTSMSRIQSTIATGVNAGVATARQTVAAVGSLLASLPAAIVSNFQRTGELLASVFTSVWGSVRDGVLGLLGSIDPIYPRILRGIQQLLAASVTIMRSLVSTVVSLWRPVIAVVTSVVQSAASVWLSSVSRVYSVVTGVASSVLQLASRIVAGSGRILATITRSATSTAASIVRLFTAAIAPTIYGFRGLAAAVGNSLATAIASAGRLGSSVAQFYSTTLSGMASMLSQPVVTLRALATALITPFRTTAAAIVSAFSTAWSAVSSGAVQLAIAVNNVFSGLVGAITTTFSAITGFIGNAFSAYINSGQAVAAGLASAFSSFRSVATESLSAIAQAMMHGEFTLAGEVAWTSLKLAFVSGIAWVTNAWSEFTAGLATIFDGVVVAVRQTWNNVTTWIASKLLEIWGWIEDVGAALGLVTPTLDVAGAQAALEQDRQRFNSGLEDARSQRDAERANAMQQRLAATEAQLAGLRRQREDALARARTAVDTHQQDSGPSPLSTAVAELKQALAAAANAPKLFDAQAAADQLQPAAASLDEMMLHSGGQGLSSQGTFSAAAVWGLAAGGVQDRTAKAAEATAANTRQLVDHARRGRLVFG